MNDYQREQLDALSAVRLGLAQLGDTGRRQLIDAASDYIRFRRSVDAYLNRHFKRVCTRTCYRSRTSACCSKDGIITFFADTVVNALFASEDALTRMQTVLGRPNHGHRCVYLTDDGCLWTMRPVVCAMFLCDRAMQTVFAAAPEAETEWEDLRREEKSFKWPNRPVLFDHIESVFLDLGFRSTLMHLNFSPGLLRIKKLAGIDKKGVVGSSSLR